MHTHLSRDMGQNFVAIFEFDTEHGIGKGFHNGPFQYDRVFLWFCQRISSCESSARARRTRVKPAVHASGRAGFNQLGTEVSETYAERVEALSVQRFEAEVEKALDLLPDELVELMDNVVIVGADRHESEPDLLGLYEGLPLTERDSYGMMDLPDRVSVYRLPLCEMCESAEELIDEIRITVIHEVAHHFGIDDERLEELGWD